jgi:hypothetical protein
MMHKAINVLENIVNKAISTLRIKELYPANRGRRCWGRFHGFFNHIAFNLRHETVLLVSTLLKTHDGHSWLSFSISLLEHQKNNGTTMGLNDADNDPSSRL